MLSGLGRWRRIGGHQAERSDEFPTRSVYVLGTGAGIETGVVSPAGVRDPIRPELIRISCKNALAAAGLTLSDIDHLMVYDAFIHHPIFALEGLGFVKPGEASLY